MKYMEDWPHGFVFYNERDIMARQIITRLITAKLSDALTGLNRAVRFMRVETPIATSHTVLLDHLKTGFKPVTAFEGERFLRPETTGGTYAAFEQMWPVESQRKKQVPLVIWQVGKSFRNEQNRPYAELRFKEFYHLEYQLIASHGSEAPYFEACLDAAMAAIGEVCNAAPSAKTAAGRIIKEAPVGQADLAHYSQRTIDILLGRAETEVAAISDRTDLPGYMVIETSIGLDRLTALRSICKEENNGK